jgi:hypothetical protein
MRRTWVVRTGGVPSGFAERMMAVPGMRTKVLSLTLARNSDSGGDIWMRRSASTVRPTLQSIITMNMRAPTRMGIQPNLVRLAAKNGRSNDRNSTSGGRAFHIGHFQVCRVTTKNTMLVMPLLWIANRPSSTTQVRGTTAALKPGAASSTPSSALRTLMAGVMIPSP